MQMPLEAAPCLWPPVRLPVSVSSVCVYVSSSLLVEGTATATSRSLGRDPRSPGIRVDRRSPWPGDARGSRHLSLSIMVVAFERQSGMGASQLNLDY